MFCTKCGNPLPQNSNFCPACNTNFSTNDNYADVTSQYDSEVVSSVQDSSQFDSTEPQSEIQTQFVQEQPQYADAYHAPEQPLPPVKESKKCLKVIISVICAILVAAFTFTGLVFSTANSFVSIDNLTDIVGDIDFKFLIADTPIEELIEEFPIEKVEEIYNNSEFKEYINDAITQLLSADTSSIYFDPDEIISIIREEEALIEETFDVTLTEKDYEDIRMYIEEFNAQGGLISPEQVDNINEITDVTYLVPSAFPYIAFGAAAFFILLLFLSRRNLVASLKRTGNTLIIVSVVFLLFLLLKAPMLASIAQEEQRLVQIFTVITDNLFGLIALNGCLVLASGIILTVSGTILKKRRAKAATIQPCQY